MPNIPNTKTTKVKDKRRKNQRFIKGPRRRNLRNQRSSVPWRTEQSRPEKFVAGVRSESPEQNWDGGRNKQRKKDKHSEQKKKEKPE